MDQTCPKFTLVNEHVGLMWSEEYNYLVDVWQHSDNHVEILPWNRKSNRFMLVPTMSTDLMGYIQRVRDGRLRELTSEESDLFYMLMRK